MIDDLVRWLRDLCADYEFRPFAVYCKDKGTTDWPIRAENEPELRRILLEAGQFEALPKESAALANIVEVSLTSFLKSKIQAIGGVEMTPGTERGYPDLELTGPSLKGTHHAVDIKVARRSKSEKQTQSRITLYTGNTYFKYPEFKWPSILRPFADYESHVDLIAIYTLDEESLTRVTDLELIVQESWKIASKERSSTTREYIGAVTALEDLRNGNGAFASADDFYTYWRAFPFNIPKSVANQLAKLLAEQAKNAESD